MTAGGGAGGSVASEGVDLCVVGAGVAGLVVAAEAARAGARVAVLERELGVGGMLRPLFVEGVMVDAGAESFALRTDAVERLVADLALPVERVSPDAEGAHLVFPGRGGEVRRAPLPRRTVLGMPADPLAADVRAVIGDAAARRAADETRLPADVGLAAGAVRGAGLPAADAGLDAGHAVSDEPSLDALVRARHGDGVADLLVDPVCRSVYSRPASEVRLSSVHPAMWRAYRELGSLTAAAAALAREARTGSAVGGLRGGMWRLAAALRADAEAHGARIVTGAEVEAADAGTVEYARDGSAHVLRAREVVVATGAGELRRLLRVSPGAARPPEGAVSLCTVAFVSRAWDAHPLGSGAIVAPGVPARAKALTHVDAKWAWTRGELPPHTHVVRLSARDDDAWTSDPELVADELALLSGVPVGPEAIRSLVVTRWRDALPPASAAERAELVRLAEGRGIRVTGAAVAGTGLASVVPHARRLAVELAPAPVPTPTGEHA